MAAPGESKTTAISQVHAELARQLEEVRARQGELTPPALLADIKASGKKHPLYDRFTWDNTAAAERWRLNEAHRLITSVRIRFRDQNDEERKVRAFVGVPRPNTAQPDYQPVQDVMLDPLKRRLVLMEAERAWKQLRDRYKHLDEFAAMVLTDLRDGEAS
jgi:hypothetical protein